MEKIFDIHNHMLWGVDDGSKDLDMSIRMLKMAQDDGTTDVILTPHNKPNRRNIYVTEMVEQIAILSEELRKRDIKVNLYPGNEIYYRLDVYERFLNGKAATMVGSRYVLIEFNPMDEWDYIKHGADEMLMAGYFPIIAHVERFVNVIKDIDRVYELRDKGCYIQVNAPSIMGELGWGIKKQCKALLKQGLVSFVASDAHEDVKRVPKLGECVRYITKKYGEDMAEKIFMRNPQMILEDKIIR